MKLAFVFLLVLGPLFWPKEAPAATNCVDKGIHVDYKKRINSGEESEVRFEVTGIDPNDTYQIELISGISAFDQVNSDNGVFVST